MHRRRRLELKGIVKNFPGQCALAGMDFVLHDGEIHALVGHNGAGKSTLIKILAGLYEKDEGEIRIEGKPVEIQTPHQAAELGLSFIHQELGLIPNFNTTENLMLGLPYPRSRVGLIDWLATAKRIEEVARTMKFGFNLQRPVKELSISEQWLVSIGRALMQDSRILVLDEPTSALTRDEVARLFSTIRRLRDAGTSIIYISHRLHEIFELADTVTVMKSGKAVGSKRVDEIDEDALITMMVGKATVYVEDSFKHEVRGEKILSVKNLCGSGVVKDVSFDLHVGEILGMAGLVGAKRTEIVKIIFGADKRVRGEIYIRGQRVHISSPQDAIRNGIAMIPEDRRLEGLVQMMPISMNITLAHLSIFRLLRRLPIISRRREKEITRQFIGKLDIKTTGPAQKVRFLSGGNQQKVVLSKWLCQRAQIFIFDEPTVGIDVGTKEEFYRLIRQLAEEGAGIVVISSDFKELETLCDRILVIREGQIAGELPANQITEDNILYLCYAGQKQSLSQS